jgi:diaminopimelate epimerase
MCGNGGRCLVKFAAEMGIIKSEYRFIAIDGEHEASIEINGQVALKMNDVSNIRSEYNKHILNTGSPHYVEQIDNVMALDVFQKGRAIRYSNEFKKEGINVNFVEQTEEPDTIFVRTYERGVEDETFSCGTGVTAAALVSYHNENGYNYVNVKTKGGQLAVEYDKLEDSFQNIWLIGPATKVFEGTIELPDPINFI